MSGTAKADKGDKGSKENKEKSEREKKSDREKKSEREKKSDSDRKPEGKNKFKRISRLIVSISNLKSTSSRDKNDPFINREELMETLEGELTQPTPKNVLALSDCLFQEAKEMRTSGTKLLYYAVLLREWLYSVKPGTNLRRATMRTEDILILAREHFELWQRLGVFSEIYHLNRSRELFRDYLLGHPNFDETDDLIIYCKVLQHLGDHTEASKIINLVISNNETHPDYANFLFFAGVIYKALGQYERANNYFFEAQQVGPPKFFTKLEMMVIISRLIEEMQGEENADDDAYKMVHAHMILEGHIPEDTDYDDWISDSKTWLQLADKCAYHQMYSLATDFYGLGITRDPDAYKKPMLWYRFAKSCKRCGRVADAQLAIKQALTRSPYKRQLLEAQKFWAQNTNKFQTTAQRDFLELFQHVPRESKITMRAFHKLQSFVRGNAIRRQVVRGIGGRKDIKKRMVARAGIVFAGKYPILVQAKADWMGQVSHLVLYDVKSGVTKHLKLKIPFTPLSELGQPRKLRLHFAWERVPFKPTDIRSKSQDFINGSTGPGEKEEGEVDGDDLSINTQVDDADDYQDKIIFTLKFVDDINRAYMQRKILLILTENPSEQLLLANSNDPPSTRQGKSSNEILKVIQAKLESGLSSADLKHLQLHSIDEGDEESAGARTGRSRATHSDGAAEEEDEEMTDGAMTDRVPIDNMQAVNKTILKDIYINNNYEKHVETNILATEVTRFGLLWHSQPFLVRILNDRDVTQICIFSVKNNVNLVFLMHRENITRSVNLRRRVEKLLSFMSQHERLQRFLPSETLSKHLKDVEEEHLTADDLQARERFNFFQGKNCFIKPLPEGNGVSIILADNNADPVIGDLYERCATIDGTAERDKFNRLAVSKSLFRDSFAFAFQDFSAKNADGFSDEVPSSPIENDRILRALQVANETVSGKNWKEDFGKNRDEGIPIDSINNIAPFSHLNLVNLTDMIEETKKTPMAGALPLIQPEPGVITRATTPAAPDALMSEEEAEELKESKGDEVEKEEEKKEEAEEKEKTADVLETKDDVVEKEEKEEKEGKEEAKAVEKGVTFVSPPKPESKPSTRDAKPLKNVSAQMLIQKAKEKSPVRQRPPTKAAAATPITVNTSVDSPHGGKVPPLNFDSPGLRKPSVKPDMQVTSPPKESVEVAEGDSTSEEKEVVDLSLFSSDVSDRLLEDWLSDDVNAVLTDAIIDITEERMQQLEEEMTQLAVDTSIAQLFEEYEMEVVAYEVAVKVAEEDRELRESSDMQSADDESALVEAVQRQRIEEERIARERAEEEARLMILEGQRLALLEATESALMRAEEDRERVRLRLEKAQREEMQGYFRDLLTSLVENIQMKAQDFNINWIRRHFLEELKRAKAAALAAAEEEKSPSDVSTVKPSKLKYFKIKSGQTSGQMKSNTHLFQRNTLTPMLNKPIKRQPVASSVAAITGADLVSPLSVHDIPKTQLKTPFAFDSADELKTVLENIDAHSLGSASQSIQHYMTNLHKQPSWINVHKGPKKAKKIQYSSTFNALYNDEENSLASVAKSLSSTSWVNGRFSIEKSVVEATTIGAAAAAGNDSVTANSTARSALSSPRSAHPSSSVGNIILAATAKKRSPSPDAAEEGLYIHSVKQVQRLGYVPTMETTGKGTGKRPWAYAAHWHRLLTDFLAAHATGTVKRSFNPNVGFEVGEAMLSDGEGSLAPSSRTAKVVHRPPFWELRKKIKALQKAISSNPNVFANTKNVPIGANPRLKAGTLSVEEIICALAETRGSVGEVITRLSDHNLEFISEIQLVCSALNVKSMVCALPGGTDLFNIELETVAHQTSSPLKSLSPAKSSKRPASENRISFILKREKSLMAAASDPENATAPTLSSFSHSQPLPSTRTSHSTAMQDDVSVLSDDARSLGSMGSLGSQRRVATTGGISFDLGRQQSSSGSIKSQGSQPSQNSANMLKPTLLSRPESLPSLRDQPGEHTHLVYPHLQISQVSPTVKKRASIVTFKPLVPLIRASTSSSIEGIGGAGVAPSLKPTFSQPDVIYREGKDGSLSPLSIGGASFSSFSPDARRMSPTQKDRDSRSNTASDLVRSTPLSAAASDAKIDTTLSRSGDGLMTPNSFTSLSVSGGNHHSLAMNALKKSFRVQQNIVDELYEEQKLLSPSLAVMSRRDAILAKQEETLLKSEKVYIREKIERKHRLRDR